VFMWLGKFLGSLEVPGPQDGSYGFPWVPQVPGWFLGAPAMGGLPWEGIWGA